MKVTHVISGLGLRAGGPVTALSGLAKAQAEAGLEVCVIGNPEEEQHSVKEKLDKAGVKVCILPEAVSPFRVPSESSKQVDAIVSASDMVHIHGLWAEPMHIAAAAARRHGVPYIVRPCGMLDPWSMAQSRLKKRIYMLWRQRRDLDLASGLHFTSRTEQELTLPLQIKAPPLLEPNGINLEKFRELPPVGSFRNAYPGEIGNRPIILFLGRLHPIKGLDILIPAFAAAGNKDAVLVLAGPDEGGYRSALEETIEKNQVKGRVVFTGLMQENECLAALVDAHLLVLPSYHENFGNVVIESLAAGTPVIVSDQVQIHHEISAAGVGAVVPTQVPALAETLTRWTGDSPLYREAVSKARPFVAAEYDWQQIALRWGSHYDRLASKRGIGPV